MGHLSDIPSAPPSEASTESDVDDSRIDPELRLRTVRTAASTIAESIRSEARMEKRRRRLLSGRTWKGKGTWRLSSKRSGRGDASVIGEMSESGDGGMPMDNGGDGGGDAGASAAPKVQPARRRNIYVNLALPPNERDAKGEPVVRYTRNKVRTTKYTPLTFIPKNLFEQFRRLANVYFLFLVVIELWPLFGAAGASIAWLPLAIILGVTAIKDGVEDYQRALQDEEVNTSNCVRMVMRKGNPNHPRDPRSWWERLLGLGEVPATGKVSRGVRKLRAKEGDVGFIEFAGVSLEEGRGTVHHPSFLDMDPSSSGPSSDTATSSRGRSNSIFSSTSSSQATRSAAGHAHQESGEIHAYPPSSFNKSNVTLLGSNQSTYKIPAAYSLSSFPDPPPPFPADPHYHPHERDNAVREKDQIWERTLWKKLQVGDVVLLKENEAIPADMVVLSVPVPLSSGSSPSHPNPPPAVDDGVCFVETKNLDGETNLKPRRALKTTSGIDPYLLASGKIGFWVDGEGPNANIYQYNGVLHVPRKFLGSTTTTQQGMGEWDARQEEGDIIEPITPSELLLRGCTLRNTPYVFGLVLNTGFDSKIMLNQGHTPIKRSKIEKETNFNVTANFVLLMVLCVVAAVASGLYSDKDAEDGGKTSRGLFEDGSEPTGSVIVNSIITFGSSLIAFQNIVPIALFISLEIVKTVQAYLIHQDLDMVYEYEHPDGSGITGTSCVPKTWNISDDLGQIEYIFSDKTGTLTQNVMSFLRCSVWGDDGTGAGERLEKGSRAGAYGEGVSEAQRGKSVREGTTRPEDPDEQFERIERAKMSMIDIMKQNWKNRYLDDQALTLVSPALAKDLSGQDQSPSAKAQRQRLINFFRALALCHTVLPSHSTDNMGEPRVMYKAESPDEAALVSCARDVGFAFLSRSPSVLTISVLGAKQTFIPLKVLAFNSTRKRMSVILRDPETGKIILYCKGADSVIYERLHPRHDPLVKQRTAENLESFANEGLRTLCVAHRIISEAEYESWAREHDEASASTGPDREDRVDEVNEKIEKGLHILGATALEDKLQEGVPEAIEKLHMAGIKLWILTGDKLQTAIEIGYSCNLLKRNMEIMILQAESLEKTKMLIEAGLNKVASVRGPPPPMKFGASSKPQPRMHNPDENGFAVVIDGETLRHALDPALKPLFLSLGEQCDTVVCCRVSPAQKALTVRLVKEGRRAMTLAIGDGANDVAMIQEANIGCGLFGLEGAQAAMSADYAFGQFRFLTKLLLVHGRWCYIRVADMHKNFFYKNVTWSFAMFWFLFFNSFDATYIYDYTFIILYNVLFTSLPVMVLGAFDQDVNAKASMAFPQLYREGIKSTEYTKVKFWAYMIDGFYQSAVVFFVPWLAWQVGDVAASWTGHDINSLNEFGTVAAVIAIFASNQYIGINTRYWTVITWSIIYGSSVLVLVWIALYSAFPSSAFLDEVVVLFSSLQFWATVVLGIVIALSPRLLYRSIQQSYFPTDRDIIREMWVKGDLKDYLGIAHRKAKKRRTTVTKSDRKGGNDLEMVSMFENAHARSTSEMSSSFENHGTSRGAYIPTGTDTPNSGTPRQFIQSEHHLSPDSIPMPDGVHYLQVSSGRSDGTRTPLPRYTAPSPAFSYYSAEDIPSNPVTPNPPHSPIPLSARIQSNNPYFHSISPAVSPNPETPILPSHPPSPPPIIRTSPPGLTNNDGQVPIPDDSPTIPLSPTPTAAHPGSNRISTSGPGGSRWIMPPPESRIVESETQRADLHTPQMSEYSAHSAYATAEDGRSSRRFSEEDEHEGEHAVEVDHRSEMDDNRSSLDLDTDTVTGRRYPRSRTASQWSQPSARHPSWLESDTESNHGGATAV